MRRDTSSDVIGTLLTVTLMSLEYALVTNEKSETGTDSTVPSDALTISNFTNELNFIFAIHKLRHAVWRRFYLHCLIANNYVKTTMSDY